MQPRTLTTLFASLMLCAGAALAQDAPPAPPPASGPPGHMEKRIVRMEFRAGDMAKHHAEMCADRYAHAVGGLAYLETKLALTDKQKPAFDRWKRTMLETAKAHSGDCAAMKMPDMKASIIDKLKLEEKMLKTHLADIQAQMPVLEALVAVLNDDQKRELDHAAQEVQEHMRGMRGDMPGMGGQMREMKIMRHDGGPDGDMPPPPPPPPQ